MSTFIHADHLTVEEERDLFVKAQAGDDEARNRIVLGVYGLVRQYAARVSAAIGSDIDDVTHVGIYKIISRFGKFDPSKGFRCSTYFIAIAKRAMLDYAVGKDRVVTLPSNPMGLSERMKVAAKKTGKGMLSLSYDFQSGDNFGDTVSDRNGRDPADEVAEKEDKESTSSMVRDALRFLHPKDRVIVEMRMEGLTLEEVSENVGITKERVRQIEERSRKKIKARIERVAGESVCRRLDKLCRAARK